AEPFSESRALARSRSKSCPTRRYRSSATRSRDEIVPWLFFLSNPRIRLVVGRSKVSVRIARAAAAENRRDRGATTFSMISASEGGEVIAISGLYRINEVHSSVLLPPVDPPSLPRPALVIAAQGVNPLHLVRHQKPEHHQ